MNKTPRHDLDEAIDRVAAKMVAFDDDARVLQAAITRLPDRESRAWFLRMPVQATAAAVLVLAALLWARPIDRPAMPMASAPIQATAPPLVSARMVVPASRRADVRIPETVSLIPVPRSPIPDTRSLLRQGFGGQAPIPEDHERSLAPVDPIEAIALSEIAAPAIELDAPALLAPLVLTELALDTEGDS